MIILAYAAHVARLIRKKAKDNGVSTWDLLLARIFTSEPLAEIRKRREEREKELEVRLC